MELENIPDYSNHYYRVTTGNVVIGDNLSGSATTKKTMEHMVQSGVYAPLISFIQMKLW
jgi:hypothetical protein